jgi:hypothetical protein
MPIKIDLLAELLKQAEREHSEYEKHLGERDANWACWYAEYVVSKLCALDDDQMPS